MRGMQPTHPPRSADDRQRLEAAIAHIYEDRIPFHQVLGVRCEFGPDGQPRMRLASRPDLVGHPLHGRLHGGVISATLDAMGSLALMVGLGDKHPEESVDQVVHRFSRMGTIDLRVDYLRPGIGAHFVASAQVMRLGGRVGSTQMRLENDTGDLIATGTGAYVVS